MSEKAEIDRLREEVKSLRLQRSERDARISELEERVRLERAQAYDLLVQLNDLRRSKSWQVTAPLRTAMRRFRS